MALRWKDGPKYEKIQSDQFYMKSGNLKYIESYWLRKFHPAVMFPCMTIYDQTCSNGQFYCNEDHLKGHQSAYQECYPH